MSLLCSNPGCKETGKSKCSGCLQISYCGSVCQKSHWLTEHKAACRFKQRTSSSGEKATSMKTINYSSKPETSVGFDVRLRSHAFYDQYDHLYQICQNYDISNIINKVDSHKHTAFQIALWSGHAKCAELLLSHGADPRIATDQNGNSCLYACSQKGYTDILKLLLEQGMDVNSPNVSGWTPLHAACFYGHLTCVQLLIDNGADLDALSETGLSPLAFACKNNHYGCVETLLKKGASIFLKDDISCSGTLLHVFIFTGNLNCMKLLLDYGADVNYPGQGGFCPFYAACYEGCLPSLELMVKYGANVNGMDEVSCTYLWLASSNGNVKTVRFLIENGATIDTADPDGKTPLLIACQEGHAACVSLLLDHGASVTVTETFSRTPLSVACLGGRSDCVKLLLAHGASVDVEDVDNASPIAIACHFGHIECVRLLLDHGVSANVVCKNAGYRYLCHRDDESTVEDMRTSEEEILKVGALSDTDIAEGCNTLLHIASFHGFAEIVKLLLSRGARVGAVGAERLTALHVARQYGHTEVAQLLMEHSADST